MKLSREQYPGITTYLIASVCTVLLAACSGGGGDSSFTPGPTPLASFEAAQWVIGQSDLSASAKGITTLEQNLTAVVADSNWVQSGTGSIDTSVSAIQGERLLTRGDYDMTGERDFLIDAVVSAALPAGSTEAGARLWVSVHTEGLATPNSYREFQVRLMKEVSNADNFIGLYNPAGTLVQTNGGGDAKLLLRWDESSPRHRIRLMREGPSMVLETEPSSEWNNGAAARRVEVAINDTNFPPQLGAAYLSEFGFGNALPSGSLPSVWESVRVTACDRALRFGQPAEAGGRLYLPDHCNNRVLGFNTVPAGDNPSPDFALGQTDLVSGTSGNSSSTLYNSRGVVAADGQFFAVDHANNRVLVYNNVPTTAPGSADVVIGQGDFGLSSSGCAIDQLNGPSAVAVAGARIFIADTSNNRVLIYNAVPGSHGTSADVVLGQNSFSSCAANDINQDGSSDSNPASTTLSGPTGVWSDGTRLFVSDSNNQRVLIWNSLPTINFTPADVVLGQGDFGKSAANDVDQNGASDSNPSAATLFTPVGGFSDGTKLLVADSDNNRVLMWDSVPETNFTPADLVLGQGDFSHHAANDDDQDGSSDAASSARTLNRPMTIYRSGEQLYIGDDGNNRVLVFHYR